MSALTVCQSLFHKDMEPYWAFMAVANTGAYEKLCESSMGQSLLLNRSFFPSWQSFQISMPELMTLPSLSSRASVLNVLNLLHSESSTLRSLGSLIPVLVIYYVATSLATFLWFCVWPEKKKPWKPTTATFFDMLEPSPSSVEAESHVYWTRGAWLNMILIAALYSIMSLLLELGLQADCVAWGCLGSLQHFIFVILHYAAPLMILAEVRKHVFSKPLEPKPVGLFQLTMMTLMTAPVYVTIDYYRNQKTRAGISQEYCPLFYARLVSRVPLVLPLLRAYNGCRACYASVRDRARQWQVSSYFGQAAGWVVWFFSWIARLAVWCSVGPIQLFFYALDAMVRFAPVKWLYSVAINWMFLSIPGLLTGKWMHHWFVAR